MRLFSYIVLFLVLIYFLAEITGKEALLAVRDRGARKKCTGGGGEKDEVSLRKADD